MPVADTEAPVALVTGGAIRVGLGIAQTLLAEGFRVWIHFHRSADAAATLERQPGVLGSCSADLADAGERHALCERVSEPGGVAGGRLDLLVNNAASFERGAFMDRTDADLLRVLTLNLVAPLSLIRRLAPVLRASAGSVVNILDRGALHPWRGRVDHCVAKAGLRHATAALASELAPVRVNAVAPGTVLPQPGSTDPKGGRDPAIPRGQIGTPTDVGQAVLFLARAPHVSGQTLVVDGGQTAAIAGAHGQT